MADRSAQKLGRLLRVRTLQLGQVRSHEVSAHERVAQEEALRARIAQLSRDVAPAPSPTPSSATGLIAAAHYRERLNQSAHAAESRVAVAEQGLDVAREATREARRDQNAIEKLVVRARMQETIREMRALEDLPSARRKRHDLC
jgi:hypothetical protein